MFANGGGGDRTGAFRFRSRPAFARGGKPIKHECIYTHNTYKYLMPDGTGEHSDCTVYLLRTAPPSSRRTQQTTAVRLVRVFLRSAADWPSVFFFGFATCRRTRRLQVYYTRVFILKFLFVFWFVRAVYRRKRLPTPSTLWRRTRFRPNQLNSSALVETARSHYLNHSSFSPRRNTLVAPFVRSHNFVLPIEITTHDPLAFLRS